MAGPYVAKRLRTALGQLHDVFDPHAALFVEVATALAALDNAVSREIPWPRTDARGRPRGSGETKSRWTRRLHDRLRYAKGKRRQAETKWKTATRSKEGRFLTIPASADPAAAGGLWRPPTPAGMQPRQHQENPKLAVGWSRAVVQKAVRAD